MSNPLNEPVIPISYCKIDTVIFVACPSKCLSTVLQPCISRDHQQTKSFMTLRYIIEKCRSCKIRVKTFHTVTLLGSNAVVCGDSGSGAGGWVTVGAAGFAADAALFALLSTPFLATTLAGMMSLGGKYVGLAKVSRWWWFYRREKGGAGCLISLDARRMGKGVKHCREHWRGVAERR